MITIRHAHDRGLFKNEWLTSYHTFSFSEYYDPKYMHFSYLRVINEDFIAPGQGFNPHSHQDMEIMTYIIDGELKHQDNMGNSSVIKSGEVQFMRAGSNVTHSEFNSSAIVTTHLLQIWIIPNQKGLKPTYAQKLYTDADKKNKLCKLASGLAIGEEFHIAQNVIIYASILEYDSPKLDYLIKPEDNIWIQVVSGTLNVNNVVLNVGDGAGVVGETLLSLATINKVEFLLFHFYLN